MRNGDLAVEALQRALRLRIDMGLALNHAICPYDLAEQLGIEVRFVDIPSLEGLYVRVEGQRPLILIPVGRPSGRRAFSCAHEIGHHIFGHGNSADHLTPEGRRGVYKDSRELQADSFAGSLLMPGPAIHRALKIFNVSAASLAPTQIYEIAQWLGVGYTTLISHLELGLNLLPADIAARLKKVQPKAIRAEINRGAFENQIFRIGPNWTGRPVDVEVGDKIIGPLGLVVHGSAVSKARELDGRSEIVATQQGLARITGPGDWATAVRVSRKNFSGRAIFRHLKEPDSDA